MRWSFDLKQVVAFTPVLAAALSLAACATSPEIGSGKVLGYGTPGVSRYVHDDRDDTLQAQLDRCNQVPQAGVTGETQGLPAACGQLRRTLRNQPGNTAQPARGQ